MSDDLDWIPRPVRAVLYRVSAATIFLLAGMAAIVGGTAGAVLNLCAGAVGVGTAGLAAVNTPRR